jgi:hypothetical protein
MMGSMTFDEAMKAATLLANSYGARLGTCLLAEPMSDGWWAFSFDILDGPANWSWSIFVNESGTDMTMFAIHYRPGPILAPRIRRRWWFFGQRELLPADYQKTIDSISKTLNLD